MATREDLQEWVIEALRALGGKARIVQICKHIWDHHESDLGRQETSCIPGNMMSVGQGRSCGTGAY